MPLFRYEKMQKGRYREFWQLGCEIIGSPSATADVEVISLLETFFTELGLNERQLELASIGCPICRPDYLEALRAHFEPNLEHLCSDCRERYEINPLRMLDCKVESCQKYIEGAPAQLDYLCPDCAGHFEQVKAALDKLEIKYNINRRMVRGLDYYTRTVFEYVSTHVGTQGSIAGGGRYDGLVEILGGKPTPAVGFAMGLERLLLEAEAQGIDLPESKVPDLYIVSFPDTVNAALNLSQTLIRGGLKVETDLMDRSLKAQMKQVSRSKSRYMLVYGTEELATNKFAVKRLVDGVETEVAAAELARFLHQEV
jgi:histidyl-tRNA synthetase